MFFKHILRKVKMIEIMGKTMVTWVSGIEEYSFFCLLNKLLCSLNSFIIINSVLRFLEIL